jgi:Fe-S-cluster containining protein
MSPRTALSNLACGAVDDDLRRRGGRLEFSGPEADLFVVLQIPSVKTALRVIQPPPAARVGCLDCAQCCTYIAIDIEPPRGAGAAADVLRLLDHDAISVRCDEDGDWFVQFETRCRNLADDNRCDIYPHRPHICRGYDDTSCEVNQPSDVRVYRTREEFAQYLERERPRLYRRLLTLAQAPRGR